jgi:hypothetical protein
MWQVILGAVTGFLGPVITQYFDLQKEKLKAEERAKDRAHELATIDKEGEWAAKKLTIEGDIRSAVAAEQSFAASYNFANDKLIPDDAKLTEKQLSWVIRIELFSKAVRPMITSYYTLAFTVMYAAFAYQCVQAGSDFFSTEEARVIFRESTYSIIGMTETTGLWWYGARLLSKRGAK